MADYSAYEVSPDMRAKHESYFEATSRNYEDSLRDLQLVLLIDRSGSMRIEDEDGSGRYQTNGMMFSGKWTRWDNTLQIVWYMAECLFSYDKDGLVPVIFFADEAVQTQVRNAYELYEEFLKNRPADQTTNLLAALRMAFFNHITNDHTLFVVVTDGCPNSGQEAKIKDLIYEYLCKQDPSGNRLNILFIRIGDDSSAIKFLQEMDDCVKIGENVDTKTDNETFQMGPKALILNAIFEHLESQPILAGLPSSSAGSSRQPSSSSQSSIWDIFNCFSSRTNINL